MTTTAAAIYEHGVLRPLSPLPLAEGTRVEVTVTDVISGGRTGAELAGRWAALPHLSAEEAVAFERDEAAIRAAEAERSSPLR